MEKHLIQIGNVDPNLVNRYSTFCEQFGINVKYEGCLTKELNRSLIEAVISINKKVPRNRYLAYMWDHFSNMDQDMINIFQNLMEESEYHKQYILIMPSYKIKESIGVSARNKRCAYIDFAGQTSYAEHPLKDLLSVYEQIHLKEESLDISYMLEKSFVIFYESRGPLEVKGKVVKDATGETWEIEGINPYTNGMYKDIVSNSVENFMSEDLLISLESLLQSIEKTHEFFYGDQKLLKIAKVNYSKNIQKFFKTEKRFKDIYTI